jgi:NitT/TauT family transport system substrate-binding protein
VNLNQQEIISAFATGTGALAAVWAPNIYTLEERTGAQLICSGKEARVTIPGALVVRRAYAEQNPDKVAAYLAVYLRSIAWEKAHRDETIKLMKEFYQKTGVNLPEKYLAREIDTRPTFTLDEQIRLFDRAGDNSDVDKWFTKLGEYLKSTGTLQDAPDPRNFATDAYLKRVAADPKLQAFAQAK